MQQKISSMKLRAYGMNNYMRFLLSYHTTSHSPIKDMPFIMVYGVDAMFLLEINMPT